MLVVLFAAPRTRPAWALKSVSVPGHVLERRTASGCSAGLERHELTSPAPRARPSPNAPPLASALRRQHAPGPVVSVTSPYCSRSEACMRQDPSSRSRRPSERRTVACVRRPLAIPTRRVTSTPVVLDQAQEEPGHEESDPKPYSPIERIPRRANGGRRTLSCVRCMRVGACCIPCTNGRRFTCYGFGRTRPDPAIPAIACQQSPVSGDLQLRPAKGSRTREGRAAIGARKVARHLAEESKQNEEDKRSEQPHIAEGKPRRPGSGNE